MTGSVQRTIRVTSCRSQPVANNVTPNARWEQTRMSSRQLFQLPQREPMPRGRPPKFTRGRLLPCGSAFATKLPATSHDTGAGEALQEAGGGALVGTEQWAQPVSNMHGGEKTGEQRLGFGNSGTEAPPWIYSSTPRERGPHTICTLASGPSSGER